jgi:3',5'-nucleoside bisphosphate phosphatase
MNKLDLHSHSTYSDGAHSVKELIEVANQLGLEFFSITNHNGIGAHLEKEATNIKNFKDNFITGVEFSSTYKGALIEILCYGFNPDKIKAFSYENYFSISNEKLYKFEKVIDKYISLGVEINKEKAKELWKTKHIDSIGCSLYYAMEESEDNEVFFSKCKNKGITAFLREIICDKTHPLYVDQSDFFPSIKQIVEIVKNAGGICFLAHAFIYDVLQI